MKFIVTSTKCGFDPKNLYDGYPWLCLCDYIIEENLPKVDGNLLTHSPHLKAGDSAIINRYF